MQKNANSTTSSAKKMRATLWVVSGTKFIPIRCTFGLNLGKIVTTYNNIIKITYGYFEKLIKNNPMYMYI